MLCSSRSSRICLVRASERVSDLSLSVNYLRELKTFRWPERTKQLIDERLSPSMRPNVRYEGKVLCFAVVPVSPIHMNSWNMACEGTVSTLNHNTLAKRG